MCNKAIWLLFVLLTLSNCTHKRLDANIYHLEGRHIDVAINYLGLPDDKLIIDEREVFVWGHKNVRSYDRPVTTYGGYNSSGGAFGGVGIVFGAGGSPYARDTYRYYCVIKALINERQIIEQMEYDSSAGGCSKYNDAMSAIERDFGGAEASNFSL